MDNRIVTASFNLGDVTCVTTPLYQYNYGNELHIMGVSLPSTFEVHFSNDQYGESTTQIGTDGVVTIPDAYLQNGGDLYAWIFLHDTESDGETKYQIMIPIHARASISSNTPTPVQQDVITEAIAALNAAVTYCDDAVDSCEGAMEHYPKIEEGFWYVWDVESSSWESTGVHAQGEQGEQGIPGQDGKDGADGKDGKDGKDGVDGHTPVITASKSGTVTTVYVDGSAIATINDGADGQDGQDGADGYSPSASVTKSGNTATITITDKNGTTTASVSDGDPSALIDDNNVSSNSTFSSSKIQTLLIADISNEVFGV